jgi:hypothetical protein
MAILVKTLFRGGSGYSCIKGSHMFVKKSSQPTWGSFDLLSLSRAFTTGYFFGPLRGAGRIKLDDLIPNGFASIK